jgi:hypothetical protein
MIDEHVTALLTKQIDERAVRIFRLIRMHTNIKEELLPKLAMLAPKEAKEICYFMIDRGFISLKVRLTFIFTNYVL